MVYKFFAKKSKGNGITNEFSYQLANELHKEAIKKKLKEKCILHLKTIFGMYI